MYKKILVPLDGSSIAECSLEHARILAKGCEATEVILLQAVEPITIEALGTLSSHGKDTFIAEKQNRELADRYLTEISQRIKDPAFKIKNVILDGHPADSILDYAKLNQIDLIIMSTHGRSGISRWFYGSVTQKLISNSPIPILLIAPEGCRI